MKLKHNKQIGLWGLHRDSVQAGCPMVEARPLPSIKSYKFMAVALALCLAVAAMTSGCKKADPAPDEEETPYTTSPVQHKMLDIVEKMGLASVSTKDYSLGGCDIKRINFYDELDNIEKKISLIEEESTPEQMVYWIRAYGNGQEKPPDKWKITLDENGGLNIEGRQYNPENNTQPIGRIYNLRYYMKNDTLIKQIKDENDEFYDHTKFVSISPTCVQRYTPENEDAGKFLDVYIEKQK